MITLFEYNRRVKLPEADYVFSTLDEYMEIHNNLTPAFVGNWKIIFVDMSIHDAKDLIAMNVHDFIDFHLYLSKQKLENVVQENPKMKPTELSSKDKFMQLVAQMTHPIDDKAMWHVYKIFDRNLVEIEEALNKLDSEANSATITLKMVTTTFARTERIYTSQIIRAFIMHDRFRWQKLDKLINELGNTYAYYSMRKQVKNLLIEKKKFLENKPYKNNMVKTLDAVSIDKLAILFSMSNNPYELASILHKYDTFNLSYLERRLQ